MANRYWVGGTGSWDATTTHWSATSGGASGASVPTLSDDVIFDTLSNATLYTVTLTTAPVCRSVTVGAPLAGAVTVAGSAAWSIYGSMTLAATNVTRTFTSALTFAATTTGFTITTNGVALASAITFSGVGGGWTLGSALTAASINQQQGAFDTANFNLTLSGTFAAATNGVRTLTLGSSSITCLNWSLLNTSNITLNAGTSTITVTQAAGGFAGGGLTYYNVFKGSNGFAINDANNTFNALTNNTVTVAGTFFCQFAGNQTIGTLTVNGSTAANGRASIQTTVALIGTQVTLTVASFVTNGFIDFRDINLAGAASPLTVSTGGDCGNNTNITLQTPKTVYWSLVGGGNWNVANSWATSSGGAPATANQPLPQDLAIIDDVGLTSGNTITVGQNNPNLGNVDASSRTLPMTLAWVANAPSIYGDLTLSSAVTVTATTGSLTFSGYNKTQTITSATVSFANAFTVNNPTVTVTLADALTSTSGFTLTSGILNLANNNLTCVSFSSNNTNSRSITFGTAAIYLTGNAQTILALQDLTNFTYSGSPAFYANYSGATGTRTFVIGSTYSLESNVPDIYVTAGTDTIALSINAYLGTLNTTGFTGTIIPATTGSRLYRNLVVGSGATWGGSGYINFVSTVAAQSITTNSVALSSALFFSGTQTYTLIDNLTTTALLTLTVGTLDLNAKTLSSGTFSSTGSSVRSIAFNGGTITVSGATFTASGTNLTTTGSGIISMTSASSKTFAGGGFSYPTLNQGGAGALVITGANTFRTIANTVAPATVTLPASTTTSIAGFDLVGSAGNLITLNSSTASTQTTINNTTGGRIGGDYLSYRDINATPASTISAGANSVSVSNNTGWLTTPVEFGTTAESITFADAQEGIRGQFGTTTESITLSDTQVSQVDFNSTNAESLTLTDAQSTQVSFAPTNAEAITFTDTPIQRGWIRINDTQTPGWVDINNYQG